MKSLEGKKLEAFKKRRRLQYGDEEDESDLKIDKSLSKVPDVDDEYARAGIDDPKIFITTSRDCSSKLKQFAKEIKLVFPNSQRINRGGHMMKEIVETCIKNGVTDLIIAHETRGIPDGLVVSHLPHGPTAFFGLKNCVMRHDIGAKAEVGAMSLAYPHLIFHNFSSPLGERVSCLSSETLC